MAAFTVGEWIRASMRKIGVLGAGEPLPADEGADALFIAHGMIDAWTLEALMIPIVNVVTHTLAKGEAEYTIGIYPAPVPNPLPVTHIETARPEKIISSFIRDGSGTDYQLEQIVANTYANVSVKGIESRPGRFYLRQGWPLHKILFNTVPYADETLHLEVIQPLSEVLPTVNLTDAINMPPGYKQELIYNLAVVLADEWGKTPSSVVFGLAASNKKRIKRSNYRPLILSVDSAITNARRNTGTYIIDSGPDT